MKASAWLPGAAFRLSAVIALGLLPWPGLEHAFCEAYRPFVNAVVLPLAAAPTQFGLVRASLAAAAGKVRDAESWDTRLTLEIPDRGKIDEVYLNLRRSAYIPLLGFVALIAAAPRRRGVFSRCLALGVPIMLAYMTLSIWSTCQWLLGENPGIGGGWSWFHVAAVKMAYRAVAVPEGNRYIVPLLVAGFAMARLGQFEGGSTTSNKFEKRSVHG